MNEVQKKLNLLKAFADKSRILIINALMKKPMYVEEISNLLDLAESTVSFHLKKLEKAGIIYSERSQYYIVYNVKEEILNQNLKDIIYIKNPDEAAQRQRMEEYKNKVFKAFFEYGKLKQIPMSNKKRYIILRELVKDFEFDKKYTEDEVNAILVKYNDDVAALRRYMVEEKLLDRTPGIYWRVKDIPKNPY